VAQPPSRARYSHGVEFDEKLIELLNRAMPVGDLVTEEVEADAAAHLRAEALAEIAAPDLETVMIGSVGGLTAEFHGVAGYEEAWADWLRPFETYSSSVEEIRQAPDGRLVVITRQWATPRGSTGEVENEGTAVLTFRDGKLSRVEFYLDRAQALRVAGLEP
jgi:ketosteroid isomerase-like protein